MSSIADNPALIIGLQAAVPLWIHQLGEHHPNTRDRLRARWAQEGADAVAYGGDTLQFGGKRGEAARIFNCLARGLAAAAYNPGGITVFGEHWCVDHGECLDADRAAQDAVLDVAMRCESPAAPTYRGRPLVDVQLPGVG